MKRHIIVIMLVSVLLTLLAIIAIWTQIVPQYQARAELRIRPIIPRLVFHTDDNGPIPFYDSYVNTQVSVIRSPRVLQRVLDEKNILETQWYKNPTKSLKQRLSGNPIPPIERLRTNLSVYPRHGTEIVEVSFVDPNAKDAKLIVDSVLDNYLKYADEITNQDKQKLYWALVGQYESLEREILGREKILAELAKSLKTEDP